MIKPNGALGHLTHPSWRSDEANGRGPTSGEAESGRLLERSYTPGSERGLLAPPTRGPLRDIDLVYYMRTGIIRTLSGRCLDADQEGLR